MGNAFAFAARLLSGLPPPTLDPPTRVEARRAVALLPLVGALLGLLAACVWNLAARLWPGEPLVHAALVLAAGAALTAGRPLGGLARAADGLAAHGAGGDRSRAFAVMRDPRRGTAGMVALAVFIALQLAFLGALPPALAWGGLILAGALGRWASAFTLAAYPLASASSGDPEANHGLADAGPNEFLIATVLVIASAAVLPTRGLLIMLAVGLVVGPAAAAVNRRLGGLSLPLAHALGMVGELTALACLALRVQ
ncbi:MAG: adenosylcobinamide-GDP ribazoletransferase [Armatimonadetes bacterium]|nr:adenosylcobinamide-GDP ribazoletransferase [Armatimonadota bacterium]